MKNVFDEAMKAYDNSVNVLSGMANLTAKVIKDYNPRAIMNQFDVLLQYSLLQVALADGYLDKKEVLFIKNITKYADLCDYLNQTGFINVTWEDIYNTNESSLSSLLKDLEKNIVKLSTGFVNVFSAVDAITEYDYLSDLRKNILLIIIATGQADGEIELCELGKDCLILNAISFIENEKKKLKNR